MSEYDNNLLRFKGVTLITFSPIRITIEGHLINCTNREYCTYVHAFNLFRVQSSGHGRLS